MEYTPYQCPNTNNQNAEKFHREVSKKSFYAFGHCCDKILASQNPYT